MANGLKTLVLGLSTIFTSSCFEQEYVEYVYINEHNKDIVFRDYPDDEDYFYFKLGKDDFLSYPYVDVVHKGDFIKDSVDAAVDRYFESGVIPTIDSLN